MKRFLSIVSLFCLLTLVVPLIGVWLGRQWNSTATSATETSASSTPLSASPSPSTNPASGQMLSILNLDTNTVEQVPLEEFVLGSVASEMPITWPDEALKAQAVASRSYALARAALNDNSDPSLQGAAFSASPNQHLGFVRTEQMQEMWGNDFDKNYARLKSLVESTARTTLQYNGATALTCYHAISAGHTESSENVWSSALPYLAGVDSTLDMTSPDYTVETQISSNDVSKALQTAFPDIQLSGDPSTWFGQPAFTAAGYVQTMPVGNLSLKGTDIRAALGLRSACFTVSYADNSFTFTTKGYGHGVGMSQYGAYTMALTGQSYDAILSTYYPQATLTTSPQS